MRESVTISYGGAGYQLGRAERGYAISPAGGAAGAAPGTVAGDACGVEDRGLDPVQRGRGAGHHRPSQAARGPRARATDGPGLRPHRPLPAPQQQAAGPFPPAGRPALARRPLRAPGPAPPRPNRASPRPGQGFPFGLAARPLGQSAQRGHRAFHRGCLRAGRAVPRLSLGDEPHPGAVRAGAARDLPGGVDGQRACSSRPGASGSGWAPSSRWE